MSKEQVSQSTAVSTIKIQELDALHKKALDALHKIPSKISNQIQNLRTNGGRALNAIWANQNLTSSQTLLLMFVGSDLDFDPKKSFIDQYRFSSLTKIEKATKLDRKTIVKVIRELLDLNYINKIEVSKSAQIRLHQSHYYCLTSKIFDEYTLLLIDQKQAEIIDAQSCVLDNGKSPELGEYSPRLVEYSPRASGKTGHQLPHSPPETPLCVSSHTFKKGGGGSRASLEIKLSEFISSTFLNGKFFDNGDSALIINEVLELLKISELDFRKLLNDISNYPKSIWFKVDKFSQKAFIAALLNWHTNKSAIINTEIPKPKIEEKIVKVPGLFAKLLKDAGVKI